MMENKFASAKRQQQNMSWEKKLKAKTKMKTLELFFKGREFAAFFACAIIIVVVVVVISFAFW
jgi:hypothetical protein